MKTVKFEPNAYKEYAEWANLNIKILKKINELIKDIDRTSFEGKGKPEALKYKYSGCWSRRINEEHRLIYKVIETEIQIISCKGHYSK